MEQVLQGIFPEGFYIDSTTHAQRAVAIQKYFIIYVVVQFVPQEYTVAISRPHLSEIEIS